jgi:hypothetical protein
MTLTKNDFPMVRVPLTFTGTDLSVNCRTQWVVKPSWARYAAIGIGWTATGTPVGVLSWEITTNPDATAGAPTAISSGPAGTADQLYVDLIETVGPYLAVSYAAGSGGTGAAWTDDSGTAGTSPTITWTR